MTKSKITVALLAVFLANASIAAQNITVYGGANRLLYDTKYFPSLYGEGNTPTVPSMGIKVGWKDRSASPYAFICNRPEFGIALQVDGLAAADALNGPGLGNIYSVFGYFDRPLLTVKGFCLEYSAGYGLGFSFSKLYDPVSNPYNRLLSIPVNSHIQLGLQAKIDLSDKYYAGLGLWFNHNSNGALNFPNRGTNAHLLALSIGMRNHRNSVFAAKPVDDGFRPGFQFDVMLSGGVMSNEAYWDYCFDNTGGGDNRYYLKYAFTTDVMYKYCRTHASGIGLDFFVTPFCKHISEYDGRGIDYEPMAFGVSIKHEMRYRNATLTAGLGRYIYDNDGIARNKKYYQMVLIKYHFPALWNTYTGLVLKAHKFMAAESIQISLGKSF